MPLFLAAFIILAPLLLAFGALFLLFPRYIAKYGKPPVRELMLRQAGETQLRLIEKLNEELLFDVLVICFAPIMLAIVYFSIQSQRGWRADSGWWVYSLISLGVIIRQSRVILRRVNDLRNRRLGYDGERMVAERLAPLARDGFLIFHDCPADEHGNIDHVVVTPSKVYAIETKTRRKRPAVDPNRSPADVIYDGRALDYPHGREDFGLDQARRQARWLSALLTKALAEPIEAQPVLALPGWMVHRTARGDVAVLNPKQLPALMREKKTHPLNPTVERRMQQISHVLESRCRDVAFGKPQDND